ncbi:MAG: pantoate--beta-alanine ligase [Terriglobia bacterium]
MEIVSKASRMREVAKALHARQQSLAFVPTMGALHEGHLSLVRRARELADAVVVSIFVNPTQFGPNEDFTRYPRDLENDCRILSALDVDYLFTPEVEEMYPDDSRTFVEVESWGDYLCGSTRPGHFRGVTTVVAKLFNIVAPDFAVFGRKDAQQAILIERMTRDLNFDVRIVTCPIVREPDGLAMSSRNRYLNPEQRQAALVLGRSLLHARAIIENGERDASVIQKGMREVFDREPLARVGYIELVDPTTLRAVDTVRKGTLIAVAAHVGTTRLIDNWSVEVP